MANVKISIPYMLREIVSRIEDALNLPLGIPMNAELPTSTDAESEGMAKIHFAGRRHFVVKLRTGRESDHGQYVHIDSVHCRLDFCKKEDAAQWIENLQKFSGPTSWTYENAQLKFELAGKRWARLEMNGSSRRNGMPEHRWDNPEHPWIIWGRQTDNPEYPNLPE